MRRRSRWTAAQRNDKNFVLTQVLRLGNCLRHASETLQNDQEVVLAAVKQRGCALDHASEELRNNKDVALAAVTQAPAAFESVSPALCADKAFVLAAVASPPSLPLSDFEHTPRQRPPADFVLLLCPEQVRSNGEGARPLFSLCS